MEQLSLAFPSVINVRTFPSSFPDKILEWLHRAVEAEWKRRRAYARQLELEYYSHVAADNQLVFEYGDLGLTRRARSLARYFLLGAW